MLICFAVTYGVFSFLNWDLNPGHWHPITRAIAMASSVAMMYYTYWLYLKNVKHFTIKKP